jgi:hypothetical protein
VRGNWVPQAPQVLLVGLIGEMQQILCEQLRVRDWELMQTDAKQNGGFITSDSPLAWGLLPEADVTYMNANLSDPDAEVTFPLCKSAALVSYRGARKANCQATDRVVGHINSRTLLLSMGTIFFAHDEFLLEQRDRLSSSTDYFEYIPKARERDIIRP